MGSRVVSREGGKLSVRASIPRTVFMALGSALLAGASGVLCVAWIVTLPEQAAEMSLVTLILTRLVTLPILLVSLAGLMLFGWGVVFFLSRLLFFRRPVFETGPEGILDMASGVGVGFVPWEEVKDVRPAMFYGQRSIAIRVRSERELLERQNPVKRLLIRISRRFFGSAPIHVPLNVLAIPEEELVAEIARHLSARGEVGEKFPAGMGVDKPGDETVDIKGRSGRRPAHPALRIAGSVARGIAVVVLSIIYYTVTAGLLMPGLAFVWNGIGPGDSPEFDHPVAGVILLVSGILFFIYFPRIVRKLTGHEVLSTPYGGLGG